MKSIINDDKSECYLCGRRGYTERHHIFFGTSNRKNSEKYGMIVYLCAEHHRGDSGAHGDRETDLKFKRIAQSEFEKTHTREEFRKIFGKSYLH